MAICNSANFNTCAVWDQLTGNLTTVGTNGSSSYYETFDQSGQLYEWTDEVSGSNRIIRGGAWVDTSVTNLSKNNRVLFPPAIQSNMVGFRIASTNDDYSFSTMVDVNDSGNTADTTGYGDVNYSYKIQKYLVTNTEYTEFLNAIAATDTYSCWATGMNGDRGGITRSGTSGSYTYAVKANMGDKPVFLIT